MNCRKRTVLAGLTSISLMCALPAVADQISITSPETVDPGESVQASVTGAESEGRVEIWGPITQDGEPERLKSFGASLGVFTFLAPDEAGSYELRYVGADGETRARQKLEVAAVPVSISAPEFVHVTQTIEVTWTGPNEAGDMIQLFNPATGAVTSEAPAVAGDDGARVILEVPGPAGPHQVRYWSARRSSAMGSVHIDVRPDLS